VGEVLTGVLRSLGLSEALARQEALMRWPDVVGARIAQVARAVAVSGDVLFVRVDSSAWLSELSLMKHDILKRLNAGRNEGRIERIVFTLAGGAGERR
jgi:predicted nucleic acid-binding Zn ribbon protein